VADAKDALKADPSFAKAALRLGMAQFELEEFQLAKEAFEGGLAVDPASRGFKMWIRKCQAELELTGTASAPASNATAATAAPAAAKAAPAPAAAPKRAAPPSDSMIRHEWYQNATHVIVTVFAKGLAEKDVKPDIKAKSVELALNLGNGREHQMFFDLFGEIDTAASTMNVMKTKIELKLKKKAEIQWEGLEHDDGVAKLSAMADSSGGVPSAYSSKRDWDSIDSSAKKELEQDKPEGEAALNKLFQDIYGNADDETRRAMIKSFQTSGGTVLSTNWGEVGEKDYEAEGIKGPDGMEWKKY